LPLFLGAKILNMNLHYFNPIDFSDYYNSGQLNWKYTLGASIEKNSQNLLKYNLSKIQIAIIGIPFDSRNEKTYSPETPKKIRSELYQLANLDAKLKVVDFGDLKPASSVKGNYQAVRDIVDYFNELKITTVIIGGSQDLSFGVCLAYKFKSYFSYSTLDAFLDVKQGKEQFNSTNYLTRLFANYPGLFQFNLIGYQNHYVANEHLKKIKSVHNHIRLGQLRDNLLIAEPVLRNTDFLSIDINAVKHSDAPGKTRIIPNGFKSEEICQLAKYAGLSSRLKIFGIFDVAVENDQQNLTVKLAAQILWYFLEGFMNRDDKRPDSQENNVKYKVEVEGVDQPLVFFKDTISGRWWMQIETTGKKKFYFACSEKEYQQASANEIPEMWINYIQKIDEVLK
jgi:arginase family enzyme